MLYKFCALGIISEYTEELHQCTDQQVCEEEDDDSATSHWHHCASYNSHFNYRCLLLWNPIRALVRILFRGVSLEFVYACNFVVAAGRPTVLIEDSLLFWCS